MKHFLPPLTLTSPEPSTLELALRDRVPRTTADRSQPSSVLPDSCEPLDLLGLAPSFADVRLWLAVLDDTPLEGARDWLSPTEEERASRFVVARDTIRYRAAHLALRRLLYARHRVPGRVEFQVGPFGKPRLSALGACEFNLSHSGGHALVAICPSFEIGADIEELRPVQDLRQLAEAHFTRDECVELSRTPPEAQSAAFLRCWTRKEACLKAIGVGLNQALTSVEVGLESDYRVLKVSQDGCESEVAVQSLSIGRGLIAALARLNPPLRPPTGVR